MGSIGEIWADAGIHLDRASFNEYGSMLKQAEGQVSKLSSFSQTALTAGFTGVSAAIGGVLAYGTSIASTFEDASTTLTTVYGDLDVAKEKFQWLGDFAASTPFEFPELLDATVKLKAYGIEAEDYLGVIGDTASAMGKTINDTVEAVADAQTGEFERLKEFGIKAVEVTKKNYQQLGVAASQVGLTALTYVNKAGEQVSAVIDRTNREMITSTITAIWNEKYAGAMETRSKTLSGMASTLKDNLTMGLADIIGFNLKTMEVQTGSLMGVFEELLASAVDLTSGLSDISEPIQALIAVAAVGVMGISALSAAFIGYGAVLPFITADTKLFGYTLKSALLPATSVVVTLALVAAGLVYLEEKTGLVSAAWQLFSDMVTIVWDGLKGTVGGAVDWISDALDRMSQAAADMGFGELQGAIDSIGTTFDNFKGKVSGFVSDVHEMAQGIKDGNEEVKKSSDETGDTLDLSSGVIEDSYSRWSVAAWETRDEVVQANEEMSDSANQAASAYQKAVADFMKDVSTKTGAGISFMSGVDIDDLSRGIRTINDELIILNENNELVKYSADGAVTKLEGMGAVTFETTRGNITILTDGITDAQRESGTLDKLINDMGNDVVVLDNTKLEGLDGQITTVGGSVTTATDNTITWEEALQNTNAVSFTVVNGQVVGMQIVEQDATEQAELLKLSLDNVNATPFSTIQGNLITTGELTYDGTSRAEVLNSTFGTTNVLPFSTIQGNLTTIGSNTQTDTGNANTLNSTFGTTNGLPFGVIIGNLTTIGTKTVDDNKQGTTLNSTFSTLGSFSFSTTISSLGSVYNKLVDVYNQAKDTISQLLKVGSSSSSSSGSSSKSSVYGYTASEAATRKANNTVYNNNKINTVNNYNTNTSTSKLKSSV